jgi:hypothetical protein
MFFPEIDIPYLYRKETKEGEEQHTQRPILKRSALNHGRSSLENPQGRVGIVDT